MLLIIPEPPYPYLTHSNFRFSSFAKLIMACALAFPTVQSYADISRLLSSLVTRSTSIFKDFKSPRHCNDEQNPCSPGAHVILEAVSHGSHKLSF